MIGFLKKLTIRHGDNKVKIDNQKTLALLFAKRPLNWEDYDWEMGLTDEEEMVLYEAFPELLIMEEFDLNFLKKLRVPSSNTIGIDASNKLRRPKVTTSKHENLRPMKATKKEL